MCRQPGRLVAEIYGDLGCSANVVHLLCKFAFGIFLANLLTGDRDELYPKPSDASEG